MLGLRVRGRGGWDRTAPVAAPKSAFLWGSTPFLCARAKKWGGTGRASAVYCPRKRRTRTKRKTRRPCHCAFCVCADTLGGSRWPVLRFDPISLVLAQRNGVEPPKKSAFLPWRLHHPRERYCLGGRDVPRPTWGGGTAHTCGADTKKRPHPRALLLWIQITTAVPEALTMSMPLSVPRTS